MVPRRTVVSLAHVISPLTSRAAACLAAVVLAALVGGLLPLAPTVPRAQAAPQTRRADDAPFGVTIESMSPSVMPSRGRITLAGTVTNNSDDTWTDLQVYLFHSASPITSQDGLAEAAATAPETDVGGRITEEGLFDEIGDLEPGESTTYTVSVSRKDLAITGEPGVYWIGTHVLGALDGVRTGLAAGRARSFMPLMEEGAPGTELAMVLPLRERVRRGTDGSLLGLQHWQRSVQSDGRLGRLAAFSDDAGGDLTWLVDPAVIDAVGSVAGDNPPLSTAGDGTGPDQEGEEPSESPSPTDDPTTPGGGTTDGGSEEEADVPSPEAEQAAAWLESFRADAADDSVMALPYGDLDVAAVASNRLGGILDEGQRLSEATMSNLGLFSRPAVAPPHGFLPARALASVDSDTSVLMTDRAYPTVGGSVVGRPDGTRVVLTDTAATAGGPGPDDRTSALAVRQRLLSEAALHALTPQRDQPLVISLPTHFDPGDDWQAANFFEGLDVPWLRRVGLGSVIDAGPSTTTSQPPLYPAGQRDAHIPLANQLATRELRDLGRVYADLLTFNDSVADQLAETGMLASSYEVRARPAAALTRARDTALRVRRELRKVEIDGPSFVNMTNEVGPIAVTVENGLDQTVTVQLEAQTRSDDLEIEVPDAITLGPGQRTPVRMRARAATIGVHNVTLVATTEEGHPLGGQDQFNVRSSNIGTVIWFVMGGGLAMLGAAIAVRLFRRVRAHRRGSAEGTQGEEEAA